MGIFTTEISASGHITGSSNLEILGNISGSATSTGSFGAGYFVDDLYVGVAPVDRIASYPFQLGGNMRFRATNSMMVMMTNAGANAAV